MRSLHQAGVRGVRRKPVAVSPMMRIVVQPRQPAGIVTDARSDAKPRNREALQETRQACGYPETPRRRRSACARLFQKLSGHAGPPGALTWGLNRRVRSGMDVGREGTIRHCPEPPLLFGLVARGSSVSPAGLVGRVEISGLYLSYGEHTGPGRRLMSFDEQIR